MKAKRFARTRAIVQVSVVTLLAGALGFAGTSQVLDRTTQLGNARLISTQNFSISDTISSSASTMTPTLLYPGGTAYFWYTVSNPIQKQLTVTSMSILGAVTAPSGCPATNLDTSHTTFGGSLTVPAAVGTTNGTASVEVGAISLAETAGDDCQGATFGFNFTGSATYAEVYSTSTALASSQNPSTVGQSVTYTATVTAAQGTNPDPVPNSPTGSVTFYDGTIIPANVITGCSPTSMNSTGLTTSTATCTPTPAYSSPGSHPITAVYSPDSPGGSPNFSGSQGSLTQVVNSNNCVSIATSGPGVTVITGTYSGNYTVNSGQTLYLNGGTITGNVTVNAGGKFTATGGTVKGNVNSSGPVSLQGTNVNGNAQATAPLSLGANTVVGGNVQVSGGATALCLSGTSSGPVKIGNNLDIKQLPTSSTPATICTTQVSGNLSYTNSGTPVIMGGSAGCTGNAVSGNFTVQNNTAMVTIGGSGFGNTVTGKITIQSNTGGGTLTNNTSAAACSLSGDTPGIVGTLNTAPAGKNTCNATA